MDLPPNLLANAAVSASLAMLADFGGNGEALGHWAPDAMRARLIRRQQDRVPLETPFGRADGTSVTFSFAGRQLTVGHSIAENVDRKLGEGVTEDVIEAQTEFAAQLSQSEDQVELRPGLNGSNELYSATSDGSIFSLSLR